MAKIEALYFIACCAKKATGGFGPSLKEIERAYEINRFHHLNRARTDLISILNSVTGDDAHLIYGRNRRDEDKIRAADQKNKNAMTGPTIRQQDC